MIVVDRDAANRELRPVQNWILTFAASPMVYLWMYLFATIDGFFPPIPSESMAIALSALSVSSGHPNLTLIILSAAAGAFTGDQIAFTIGKRLAVTRFPLMRSPRGRRTLDWAQRTLARRGGAFILGARYFPVGRVAVNMTAGAVGYSRRRFAGFVVISSLTWAMYCAAIGIGAGAWFKGHPVHGIVVGVVGGLLIGVILDFSLGRLAALKKTPPQPSEPAA